MFEVHAYQTYVTLVSPRKWSLICHLCKLHLDGTLAKCINLTANNVVNLTIPLTGFVFRVLREIFKQKTVIGIKLLKLNLPFMKNLAEFGYQSLSVGWVVWRY